MYNRQLSACMFLFYLSYLFMTPSVRRSTAWPLYFPVVVCFLYHSQRKGHWRLRKTTGLTLLWQWHTIGERRPWNRKEMPEHGFKTSKITHKIVKTTRWMKKKKVTGNEINWEWPFVWMGLNQRKIVRKPKKELKSRNQNKITSFPESTLLYTNKCLWFFCKSSKFVEYSFFGLTKFKLNQIFQENKRSIWT